MLTSNCATHYLHGRNISKTVKRPANSITKTSLASRLLSVISSGNYDWGPRRLPLFFAHFFRFSCTHTHAYTTEQRAVIVAQFCTPPGPRTQPVVSFKMAKMPEVEPRLFGPPVRVFCLLRFVRLLFSTGITFSTILPSINVCQHATVCLCVCVCFG